MKIIKNILIIIFILICVLPICTNVYATPEKGYWKDAWDNLKNIDLSTDMIYWPAYNDAIGNALGMTDNDLKNLDNSKWDRAAFLQILEKYLDDNNGTANFEGTRNQIIEIQNKMKNLKDYYEQQGKPYIDGEKEILGIPIVDEDGNEQTDDIITSGEAAENTNRIDEINSILESGIENGEVITEERRQELEAERNRLQEANNERAEEVNNK